GDVGVPEAEVGREGDGGEQGGGVGRGGRYGGEGECVPRVRRPTRDTEHATVSPYLGGVPSSLAHALRRALATPRPQPPPPRGARGVHPGLGRDGLVLGDQ